MSYEYRIKAQDNILFLEKLRHYLVNEKNIIVCDSNDKGFSAFFAENKVSLRSRSMRDIGMRKATIG